MQIVCFFFCQIKIWFQNRRTKWKRKYTSDVETLASQYYAQIGIGGIARPMVVGDRLWLFSQAPSVSHPQSMMLNNGPVPLHSVNATIRGFAAPQPLPPPSLPGTAPTSPLTSAAILENPRNSYLARNQALNYCPTKPASFFQRISPHLKPYEALLPSKYHEPVNRGFPDLSSAPSGLMSKEQFNKFLSNQNPNYREALMTNYLEMENMKFAQNSSAFTLPSSSRNETEPLPSVNSGIAELERAFGNTNRCSQLLNSEAKCLKNPNNEINFKSNEDDDNHCSSDNSDVDCEEIDDT